MFTGKSLTKLNSDWASRTLRTSKLATDLARQLAGSSLKQLVAGNEKAAQIKAATDELIGRELAQSLGELKGLTMKIGQMAGYIDLGLPEGVRKVLETLFDSTPPMAAELVNEIFLQELGRRPEDIFSEWEASPFAAASIGQVHKAKLVDGTCVAVKVQYPTIVEALKADLKNVDKLDSLLRVLMRHQEPGLVEELRSHLLDECDYRLEARNLEEFRRLFASDPEVLIPPSYPELTTQRVLVTKLMDGVRFTDFVRNASQEERDRAGTTIFRFNTQAIFRHRLFNTDPNPGNFLFQDGRVVFLDFGSVKRFSPKTIDAWRDMYRAAVLDDLEGFKDAFIAFGMAPRPEKLNFANLRNHVRVSFEPYLHDRVAPIPEGFDRTVIKDMTSNPDRFKLSMPPDWYMATRFQGVLSILARLGSRANWYQIWNDALG